MRYIKRLMLKLTNECNLASCKYCYTEAKKPEAEKGLSLDVYKNLITHLLNDQPYGKLEELSLTGGEPFLRDDLINLVDFSLSNKISTRINTNGTFINENSAKSLCNIAEKYDTQLIFQIGLDSADRKIYEFIRGKDTFEKAIKGINYLVKSRNENITISLRYTIMKKPLREKDKIIFKDAEKDVKDYVKLADALKVNKIKIRELLTSGRGYALHNFLISGEEVAKVQETFIDEIRKYPILNLEITWPCYFGNLKPIPKETRNRIRISPCRCLDYYLTVDVDGGIVGCVLLIGHKEQYLGNILKDDIIQIFNSSIANKMLKERYRKGRKEARCFAIDHTHKEAQISSEERRKSMKKYFEN